MLELDTQRQARFTGYTAIRHYFAVNKQRRAEMLVRELCSANGAEEFTILSEQGSYTIRKLIFHRMLKEEVEASRPEIRQTTRITPANYDFQSLGRDVLDGRPAYVLQLTPKKQSRYVIEGKMWVDAADYSIVRIEGRPARSPSFWTRNVHFVHTYQKVGPFWLAASTHWESEIPLYGTAELTVNNSGYVTRIASK